MIATKTKGDTLEAITAQLRDGNGDPVDIESETIQFRMSNRRGAVIIDNASANNDQQGDGIAIISGITQADPAVVTTSSAHGISNGDRVQITGVHGMTELNGREFTAANVASTTLELEGEDSRRYTAYGSGGRVDTRGFVSITLTAAQITEPGRYKAQFLRVSGGATEHYPPGGFDLQVLEPV